MKCSISSNNYHYWVNVSFQEYHILSTWKSNEWVDWFPSELNIRPLLSLKPGNAVGFKYVTNASVIVLHYLVQGNTRQILLQNFNNSYVKMASNTYTIHRNLIIKQRKSAIWHTARYHWSHRHTIFSEKLPLKMGLWGDSLHQTKITKKYIAILIQTLYAFPTNKNHHWLWVSPYVFTLQLG